MAARTSAVPELTAESCTSRAPVSAAMSRASVVLPQPGGPKKSMLKSCPPSTAARSTVPGPTMCSCPANSASVRGRMRAASGASACTWSSLGEKRSIPRVYLLLSGTMRKVLVLNTTYEPLNVCSVRRALILLLKDKAEMLEQSGAAVHSERDTFPVPLVIRLRAYVRVPRRSPSARISRRAVFARDRHRCQYCGSARHLTVDHVVPRSRGGPDTWDNLVTSCAPCNRKKGDRPLDLAGLRLLRPPRAPGPAAFVLLHVDHVHESWRPYLSYAS